MEYRFEIIDVIAEGAFGKILKAHDKTSADTQSIVAIKIFKEVFSVRTGGLNSDVLREISTLCQLQPGATEHFIVKLLEIVYGPDTSPLQISLVFPYYESNFRHVQVQSLSQILRYTKQLLTALQYCHRQGIWHRDLKPENILYDRLNDSCILADFGLARPESQFRFYTHHVATIEYRAHELFWDYDKYDGAALDLWALGTIVLEMLLGGVHPWDAPSEILMLRRMYETLGAPAQLQFFQQTICPRNERMGLYQYCYDTCWEPTNVEFKLHQFTALDQMHFHQYAPPAEPPLSEEIANFIAFNNVSMQNTQQTTMIDRLRALLKSARCEKLMKGATEQEINGWGEFLAGCLDYNPHTRTRATAADRLLSVASTVFK